MSANYLNIEIKDLNITQSEANFYYRYYVRHELSIAILFGTIISDEYYDKEILSKEKFFNLTYKNTKLFRMWPSTLKIVE